jgi:diguanylate cyclase (GGDEF)-like protein
MIPLMSSSQRRDSSASSPQAIRRLAVRGYVLLYVIAVALMVTVWALAGSSSDPLVAAATVALGVGMAVAALMLGLLLLFTVRRMSRHVRSLEVDRSGLQHAYDRARLDSLLDGLTGLGNHRAFQEALDDELAIAREDKTPVALLMIDVDDLKQTNDRHGHMAGDEVLRAVAQIMRANLRRSDRAFRVGGDEFALLLPGCDLDGAEAVAHHLLAAALSGNHGSHGAFSITVGSTAYPEFSSGRQQMILHADAALYAGKRHGRTTVERFDPRLHGIAEDSRSLAELTSAVERVAEGGLVRAVYQPIFSLRTGAVVGYEGLVRLSPDAGFPDPTSLFVAAEATRRTIELDIVCAKTVLAGAGRIGPEAYIAINLSPRTMESDAFSALEIVALARRHSISPSQLVVELTEREAVEALSTLQAAVATLRRHGVRIAIDDVGAGNAGLRLLSEVEFDIMKVDLSLVRAGARHESSEAVLRALGAVATERGRKIVAEGIETPDLLEAVLELRFDSGQGYLLGRPGVELVDEPADLFAMMAATETVAPTHAAA